jgi:hypothetical protein
LGQIWAVAACGTPASALALLMVCILAEFLLLPRLNDLEQANLDAMKGELQNSIKKGTDFMNNS